MTDHEHDADDAYDEAWGIVGELRDENMRLREQLEAAQQDVATALGWDKAEPWKVAMAQVWKGQASIGDAEAAEAEVEKMRTALLNACSCDAMCGYQCGVHAALASTPPQRREDAEVEKLRAALERARPFVASVTYSSVENGDEAVDVLVIVDAALASTPKEPFPSALAKSGDPRTHHVRRASIPEEPGL